MMRAVLIATTALTLSLPLAGLARADEADPAGSLVVAQNSGPWSAADQDAYDNGYDPKLRHEGKPAPVMAAPAAGQPWTDQDQAAYDAGYPMHHPASVQPVTAEPAPVVHHRAHHVAHVTHHAVHHARLHHMAHEG